MALLCNDLVKKHYTREIGEYTLIETNKLIETFEMDNYWMDSYTKYTKKIGLTSNGRFLDESTDVVLDFPYKDTVLKAGMSKEDVEKEDLLPNEPFYNEVIAAEEIDTLLDKKVLVNAKRYTTKGDEDTTEFFEEDNLILKGNNLLGLHTLKEKYAGKVKLIYIDPPYNTGSDSFMYNDKFNHSTWLTFMKSRLEIARDMLSEDGVIAVHIDDSEGVYLKVLMDSIFGRESGIFTQYILVRYASKTLKSDMDYHKQIEQIHYYKKSESSIVDPIKTETDYNYSKFEYSFIEKTKPRETIILGDKRVDIFSKDQIEIKKIKPSQHGLKEIWASGTILDGNSSGRFFRDNLMGRYEEDGYGVVYRVWGIGDDGYDYRYFTGPQRIGATKGKYYQGVPSSVKNGEVTTKFKPIEGFLDLAGSFGNIRGEGGVEMRSGKKPEKMLREIIKTYSSKNDIILDFFGGSGTTAATAMKMNRRFITIEQIEEQVGKIINRISNVINGDPTGISKEVDWQGGGSFVYAELMEKSRGYLDSVLEAENTDSLKQIYQLMLDNVDLDFRADLEAIQELLNDTISLDDKKRLLVKVIDKNQLYYNYSEIDDANVRDLINDTDYIFNQSFYKEEEIDDQEDQ